MAITGLNWGSMKNAARPATEMAHSTAMTTSSRAWGRRPSNTRKNGSHALQQHQHRHQAVSLVIQVIHPHEQGHGDQQQDGRRRPPSSGGTASAFPPEAAPAPGAWTAARWPGPGSAAVRRTPDTAPAWLLPQSRQPCRLSTTADRSVTLAAYRKMAMRPRPGHGGQGLAPQGQPRRLPVRRLIPGLRQRRDILRQRRLRRHRAAAGGHHVLRRHRAGAPDAAGHAVGGGGIEAVAGEEGPGRRPPSRCRPSKNRAQRWA